MLRISTGTEITLIARIAWHLSSSDLTQPRRKMKVRMIPVLLVAVFAFKTGKNGKYKEYISGIDLIGVF
jgi:hypothetical protein